MFLDCSHHEGHSDGSLVDNWDCSVGKKAGLQWKAQNVYYWVDTRIVPLHQMEVL